MLSSVLAVVIAGGIAPPGTCAIDYSLQARMGMVRGHPSLHFTLRNKAKGALVVQTDSLPWNNRYAAAIVAIHPHTDSISLRPWLPVADPRFELLEIRPDDQVEGDVDLQQRFPQWKDFEAGGEIVLFWTYQLRSAAGCVGERVFGGLKASAGDQSASSR